MPISSAPPRFFTSEFSLGISTDAVILMRPSAIRRLTVNNPFKSATDLCHIYMIVSRPVTSFVPGSVLVTNDRLSGRVKIQEGEKDREIDFYADGEFSKIKANVSDFPHKKIIVRGDQAPEDHEVIIQEIMSGAWLSDYSARNCKVEYIGQAFGDGGRKALDRLKSHSTLQSILSEIHDERPNVEVLTLMFEIPDPRAFMIFDGRSAPLGSEAEDNVRLDRIIGSNVPHSKRVSIFEAALIRYFKPKYNVTYKESFPRGDMTILQECFDLDFTALVVEINTEDIRLPLYSDIISPGEHHIAQFDLADTNIRRSFFGFEHKDGEYGLVNVSGPKQRPGLRNGRFFIVPM